jgi:hypothetical protein
MVWLPCQFESICRWHSFNNVRIRCSLVFFTGLCLQHSSPKNTTIIASWTKLSTHQLRCINTNFLLQSSLHLTICWFTITVRLRTSFKISPTAFCTVLASFFLSTTAVCFVSPQHMKSLRWICFRVKVTVLSSSIEVYCWFCSTALLPHLSMITHWSTMPWIIFKRMPVLLKYEILFLLQLSRWGTFESSDILNFCVADQQLSLFLNIHFASEPFGSQIMAIHQQEIIPPIINSSMAFEFTAAIHTILRLPPPPSRLHLLSDRAYLQRSGQFLGNLHIF